MATEPKRASRRWLWRIVLIVLVVLPLLPELVVLGASAVADLSGCRVNGPPLGTGIDSQVPPDPSAVARGFVPTPGSASGSASTACAIWPHVSSIIRLALNAGSFVGDAFSSGVVIIWLTLCYVVITRAWTGFLARMMLALLVGLIFAVIPYFGIPENQICQPDDVGADTCLMYGGDVRSIMHQNVVLGMRVVVGAPLAFGSFLLYLLFLLVAALVFRKAAKRSA
jgi:hypothetical protein